MGLFIADAHCDALLGMYLGELSGVDASVRVGISSLRAGGVGLQVFAIFVPDRFYGMALEVALDMVGLFYRLLDGEEGVVVVRSRGDLEEVVVGGKLGVLLSLEGAEPLGRRVDRLWIFERLGVRLITLAWSRRNSFADGVGVCGGAGYGLTELGRELVLAMNRSGILVDVSHLSERGFYEVLEVSSKPVVASHSNVRKLVDHPRNLWDEQILGLVQGGGMVGINFYPPFLTGRRRAELGDVVRHIDYVCQLTGSSEYVGLGSDFDGIEVYPEGLDGPGDMGKIGDLLFGLGYSQEDVRRVMGGNFARVLRENLLEGKRDGK